MEIFAEEVSRNREEVGKSQPGSKPPQAGAEEWEDGVEMSMDCRAVRVSWTLVCQ